jgi:hypothetical protein
MILLSSRPNPADIQSRAQNQAEHNKSHPGRFAAMWLTKTGDGFLKVT